MGVLSHVTCTYMLTGMSPVVKLGIHVLHRVYVPLLNMKIMRSCDVCEYVGTGVHVCTHT